MSRREREREREREGERERGRERGEEGRGIKHCNIQYMVSVNIELMNVYARIHANLTFFLG